MAESEKHTLEYSRELQIWKLVNEYYDKTESKEEKDGLIKFLAQNGITDGDEIAYAQSIEEEVKRKSSIRKMVEHYRMEIYLRDIEALLREKNIKLNEVTFEEGLIEMKVKFNESESALTESHATLDTPTLREYLLRTIFDPPLSEDEIRYAEQYLSMLAQN